MTVFCAPSRGSPTRNLVRLQQAASTRSDADGRHFPSKETKDLAASTLGCVELSGCSSVGERVVGDHEDAGAIPVIQTNATAPRMGHKTTNLVGWGSIPFGGARALWV